MTAVLAEFVDCRPVKSRSVLQLVFEVPIEQADKAVAALGGFPLPGQSRWAGLALAPKERQKAEKLSEAYPGKDEDETQKKRRQFDSLQPSAQAAILAQDPEFLDFMRSKFSLTLTEPRLAEAIRSACSVESRSEFNTDVGARNRWEVLRGQFKQFQTDRRYESSQTR